MEGIKTMAYNAKAQKKYREKTLQVTVKYTPTDIKEGKRVKEYLAQTGQSANSYIKSLIKQDLDSKGVSYGDTGSNGK